MVETIKELSSLSRKLNQSSDRINSIISTLNEKLMSLNLGVETWLESEPVESGELQPVYQGQVDRLPRRKLVSYLGYCRFDDGWALAIKSGCIVEDWDKEAEALTSEFEDVVYRPLLKTSREARANSLRLVPRLLDEIKREALGLMESIEEAEKAAEKL